MQYSNEDKYKLRMLCVLLSLMDDLLKEIHPSLRHAAKRFSEMVIKHNRTFIRNSGVATSAKDKELMDEVKNYLREIIDEIYKQGAKEEQS